MFVCAPLRNIVTQCWYFMAVCSWQVAIQISFCCLSKRFFILGYCVHCDSKQHYLCFKEGQRLHFSHKTVSNILSKFLQNETAAPGKPGWKERSISTPNVVEFVEYCKVFKPSTRSFEIQLQGLLAICTPASLPAQSNLTT